MWQALPLLIESIPRCTRFDSLRNCLSSVLLPGFNTVTLCIASLHGQNTNKRHWFSIHFVVARIVDLRKWVLSIRSHQIKALYSILMGLVLYSQENTSARICQQSLASRKFHESFIRTGEMLLFHQDCGGRFTTRLHCASVLINLMRIIKWFMSTLVT